MTITLPGKYVSEEDRTLAKSWLSHLETEATEHLANALVKLDEIPCRKIQNKIECSIVLLLTSTEDEVGHP